MLIDSSSVGQSKDPYSAGHMGNVGLRFEEREGWDRTRPSPLHLETQRGSRGAFFLFE